MWLHFVPLTLVKSTPAMILRLAIWWQKQNKIKEKKKVTGEKEKKSCGKKSGIGKDFKGIKANFHVNEYLSSLCCKASSQGESSTFLGSLFHCPTVLIQSTSESALLQLKLTVCRLWQRRTRLLQLFYGSLTNTWKLISYSLSISISHRSKNRNHQNYDGSIIQQVIFMGIKWI